MSLEAGASLGRYQIVALLGAGGMGQVFRARDPRLGRDVAVKIVAPGLSGDDEALARFEREARTIAAISHPNILAIYDIGHERGIRFLVTELLDGESLRERLSRGPLPWENAVQVTIAICEGLARAHEHRIVHRDIKPENVFITGDGRVKILDFGVAHSSAADEDGGDAPTRPAPLSGALVGTIAYMSPEQVQGDAADPRSDIFAVGCMLHEMLSGRRPFDGRSAADTIAAILRDRPPALAGTTAPAQLIEIVGRCLEKTPGLRFQSAAELAAALGACGPGPAATGIAPRPSVAVLPFLNLSADPENEYFADGITEDVIAHLSKTRALKVISRTSAAAFRDRNDTLRDIGDRLGTGTILDGSVRRAGNRVRIVARLVECQTNEPIWSETYDRELTDIFGIQTDVALQICSALRAELSLDERTRISRPPTRDLEAYGLYLQGRQLFIRYTREAMHQSVALFEQAAARDPRFALAYAAQAVAYAEIGIEGGGALKPIEAYALGREAATRALAIDPRLGDAHAAAGQLLFIHDFDWAGAEREIRLALELSPGSGDTHDLYGRFCSALARHDEAIEAMRKARDLDPLAHRTDVGTELLRAGRFAEALADAERVVAVEPGFARGQSMCGWAYLFLGRPADGIAALERAVAFSGGSTVFLGQLGEAYAMAGEPEKARDVLRQLDTLAGTRYVPPYHFAYVYTGLGLHETAMDYLERGYEERAGAIYGIKGSFLFTPLRSHPRFLALLRRMNLL